MHTSACGFAQERKVASVLRLRGVNPLRISHSRSLLRNEEPTLVA